jgi:hypothetical protein
MKENLSFKKWTVFLDLIFFHNIYTNMELVLACLVAFLSGVLVVVTYNVWKKCFC